MLSPMDIKIELLKRGISTREIARRVGVTNPAVSFVIHRKKLSSGRIRQAVADAIGMPYKEVWGEPFTIRRGGWLKGRPRKKAA